MCDEFGVVPKKSNSKKMILTDDEFAERFKNLDFPLEQFSHEAHLRLAWIHINKSGTEKGISIVCDQLKAFVISVDAENKYNQTLTVAAIKIVNHFILKSKSENFIDFLNEFPRLKTNFKDLLDAHYSDGTCFSEYAKKEFVEPDLLMFD